jgi:hypothetical protein
MKALLILTMVVAITSTSRADQKVIYADSSDAWYTHAVAGEYEAFVKEYNRVYWEGQSWHRGLFEVWIAKKDTTGLVGVGIYASKADKQVDEVFYLLQHSDCIRDSFRATQYMMVSIERSYQWGVKERNRGLVISYPAMMYRQGAKVNALKIKKLIIEYVSQK